jgi:hypothetical protein
VDARLYSSPYLCSSLYDNMSAHSIRAENILSFARLIKDDYGFESMNDFLLALYTDDNSAVVTLGANTLKYRRANPAIFLPRSLLDAM